MVKFICENLELLNKIKDGKFNWNESEVPPPLSDDIGFYLLIDGIKVVQYRVSFERVNSVINGITSAEIQYSNLFAASDSYELKEKYLGKGYVKYGLKIICDYLIQKCNIPYIHADIDEDNIISQRVASSCGFIDGVLYHPNARFLYQKALGDKISKESLENIMYYFDLKYENTLSNNGKKR